MVLSPFRVIRSGEREFICRLKIEPRFFCLTNVTWGRRHGIHAMAGARRTDGRSGFDPRGGKAHEDQVRAPVTPVDRVRAAAGA